MGRRLMDRRTLGLAIALTYPERAFAGESPLIVEQSRHLVERAGRQEAVGSEVAQLLSRSPRLNEWVEQLLEDGDLVPPHLQSDQVRSYAGLTGMASSKPPRYHCPEHDVVWYRMSVADTVPPCSSCEKILSRC